MQKVPQLIAMCMKNKLHASIHAKHDYRADEINNHLFFIV